MTTARKKTGSTAKSTARAKAEPATLSLSVQYACNDEELSSLPTRPQVRRWAKKALEGESAEVTVRFVDAEEGQMLNREYRHKDYATNVLSFPYLPNPQMAGDLVLCLPVVLKEAADQKKPVETHFAHLIVHGMLHLQGYDHETNEADAEFMEAREREILAALGYPDPYLSEREPQA